MTTPTPDTSNANVARVLRQAHAALLGTLTYGLEEHRRLPSTLAALADALDAQPAVTQAESLRGSDHPLIITAEEPGDTPTWEERTDEAMRAYNSAAREDADHYSALVAALRAFAPELAPPTED